MTLVELSLFAIQTIQAIVAAVQDAHSHKITPEQAHARILALRGQLAANDAAADQALATKFPPKETP